MSTNTDLRFAQLGNAGSAQGHSALVYQPQHQWRRSKNSGTRDVARSSGTQVSAVTTFSNHFKLSKTQGELDFVDVQLERDMPLFVDPFALSIRQDRWGMDAHSVLVSFFQAIIDRIRSGHPDDARRLLVHLSEPNETRLGLSRGKPKGAGIGWHQAGELLQALRESQAVKTGFLSALEECELMIPGIGRDKISDLATNVLRDQLAAYTADQCELHNIAVQQASIGPCFNPQTHTWENTYLPLPIARGGPVLLVPKSIARYEPAYDHREYYRHFTLNYLQAEHLEAGSSLIHTFKNGRRTVHKKELEAIYPCTKQYLFEFSRTHPEVLAEYRQHLSELERKGTTASIATGDEEILAAALRAALLSIPGGSEAATIYHRLMIGILEFVFYPHLVCPRKEVEIHEGRKRIDIVMENAASTGIFNHVHAIRKLPSSYVAFECKNYTREIANPELDQIAGRFSVNRGKIGFVCCRAFDNRQLFVQRCRDTFKDDRGLIIGTDDQLILSALDLISRGYRRNLDAFVSKLVDEVWLS